MKKTFALLLSVVVILCLAATAFAADFDKTRTWSDTLFGDVAEKDWYYETIKNAYELGLMSGDNEAKFNPKGDITFAETVAVAARIHSIYTTGEENFVQGTPWYQVYIDYALEHGILTASSDDVKHIVTRLEFAEIISRTLPQSALPAINRIDDGMIPDVEDNAAVYMLYRAGILTGNDAEGTFSPDATIARSEVATIVARMATSSLRQSIALIDDSMPIIIGGGSVNPPAEEPEEDDTVPPAENEQEPADIQDIEDILDASNALTDPFDQVYPDLFAEGNINYNNEHILIKVAAEPSGLQQASLFAAGVSGLEQFMNLPTGKWYKAFVTGDINAAMDAVRALDFVLVAEYDYVYETDSIIECTPEELGEDVQGNGRLSEQWYLRTSGLKKGWDNVKNPHYRPDYDEENGSTEGEEVDGVEAGEGIVVAVIDTGVDYKHIDLAANIWINKGEIKDNGRDDDGNGYVDDYYGWNAVAENGDPMDDHGHGTHVAGIIAAVNDGTKGKDDGGIVGIAYNAEIMCIKAGMASGYFNQSDIAEAIIYAYANGADVINMSFGGSASSIAVQEALATAYTRSVLVAAAGNNGYPNERPLADFDPVPAYPAALSYVIGVMSVDQNGQETSFTNWDVNDFNSVEYEVYAPGYQILSTIPGDRYATWSGTSMAAPVVSGIAALVRSEYRDANTYPTKFIYGQICATGTQSAACLNPNLHGPHNLPLIVDAYNALTVLPNPEVGVMDYAIFDTIGLQGNSINNGDGVIDAGETIAIGFTLRNSWGKSKNTIISVDTLSQAGIADPYITIHNNDINVGEVGTYSTQDCGKVMEDDAFIAWENPIYLTIAQNCPNDYLFNLNVTVNCENALDAEDEEEYISNAAYNLAVRRGKVLPSRIKEDMTLTADDYYIIAEDTLIMEGVTVTVEPGTQIQFWNEDPADPYAEKKIVHITVEGTLLCNGTAENPIEIFPSELMSEYRVEITEKNTGYAKLKYTNIVNPYISISYACGCEFTQNYTNEDLWYRVMREGKLVDSQEALAVIIAKAENCAFYRLSGGNGYYSARISGDYFDCIFADCNVSVEAVYGTLYKTITSSSFDNCLFYGNNSILENAEGNTSRVTIVNPFFSDPKIEIYPFIQNNTNRTYFIVNNLSYFADRIKAIEAFAEYLGGTLACINSEEEMLYLQNAFMSDDNFYVGMKRDYADDSFSWVDGSATGDFLQCIPSGGGEYALFDISSGQLKLGYLYNYWANYSVLIELPYNSVNNEPVTKEYLTAKLQEFAAESDSWSYFSNNAIINRLNDADVSKWMKVQSPESSNHEVIPITNNYWGTTNTDLIAKQIYDFDDLSNLMDLDETPILTEAPENVWPFVVKAGILDAFGNETVVVGNELLTFYVEFNRDMDTTIPLNVRFGSAYPYADYQVEGEWVSERRWEGSTTLTTLIEGGYQLWSIDNGKAKGTDMKLYKDWGRFPFEIDTSEALAMVLQGNATAEGIELTWMQDDFDTLMGYNVYRADQDEDAFYQRLNSSIIPVGEEEFFDDTVEPGKDYYYIFTVVKTDLSESEPSGKIKIQSLDTMSPVLYHTPVYEAYVGSNLIISATATDNLQLTDVLLHYSVAGGAWQTAAMQNIGDKYSALISGNNVTLDGLSYYITASDGVSTVNRGSESDPFVVVVKAPSGELVIGDVNGDGWVGIADALLVLRAKNNKVVLTSEQFIRADLDGDGILSAAEALKILRYANGEINTLQ